MNSSQVLTIVAIFVIAFAAFNLIITMDKVGKLTGYAGQYGSANLTIESSLVLNFTVDKVNWSSGYISSGLPSASLDSEGNNINVTNFQLQNKGLELESLSSVNISVNLSSNVNGITMFSDSLAILAFKSSNNETANGLSCSAGLAPTVYTPVVVGSPGTVVCTNLQFYPNRNSMEFDLRVNFTTAATTGPKMATITAAAWCGPGNC